MKINNPILSLIYIFLFVFCNSYLFSQIETKPEKIESNVYGFNSLQNRAHSGKMKAQYNLGRHHADRKSPDFNIEKAKYWFNESSKQGFRIAYYELGNMYSNYKVNDKKDYKIAYEYYKKGAALGEKKSTLMKAKMLMEGLGVEQNYKVSKKILDSMTFQRKYDQAAFHLAEFYIKGFETKIDTVQAIKLLLRAKGQHLKGKVNVVCRLVRLNEYYWLNKKYDEVKKKMLSDGFTENEIENFMKIKKEAKYCYEKKIIGWEELVCTAANGTPSRGYFSYSEFKKSCQDCFKNPKNLLKYKPLLGRYTDFIINTDKKSTKEERAQVIGWMEESLNDDPRKNYLLGRQFLYGSKTLKKDIDKACTYLKFAYEKKYKKASRDYAIAVLSIGVKEEVDLALKILDNPNGFKALALYYYEGNILPKDNKKALEYALRNLKWTGSKYIRKSDDNTYESISDNLFLALGICKNSKTCDNELRNNLEVSLEKEMQCSICLGIGELECSVCKGKGLEYYDTGAEMNSRCRTCKGSGVTYCAKTVNEPSSVLIKYFKN